MRQKIVETFDIRIQGIIIKFHQIISIDAWVGQICPLPRKVRAGLAAGGSELLQIRPRSTNEMLRRELTVLQNPAIFVRGGKKFIITTHRDGQAIDSVRSVV